MMDRTEFVAFAAAQCLKSAGDEVHQREQARHAKETAEKLAEALGLGISRSAEQDYDLQQARMKIERLEELVRDRDTKLVDVGNELAAKASRIGELEEQLEQATAPAAQKGRRA